MGHTVRNADGSSSYVCSTIEVPIEDQQARREVYEFAAETFLRQRDDWLDVRRRSKEADSPEERARCHSAARQAPPPSLDFCLDYSRGIRRKREVDFRSTL